MSVEQCRSIHEVELEAFMAATLHHSTPFPFVDFQSSCYEQRLPGAPSDTMDTRSNGTSTESEQSGSAVAEGRRREHIHGVSDLSRPLTLSHISQRRLGSSDLSRTSSHRGHRPRSHVPRGNPYPSHSNETSPATGVSAHTAPRTSRESKEPPRSYFQHCASEIRGFEQQWTLDDALTPELHKLTVQVSALAKEYSVNPDKRTENETTYRSLCQLGQEETHRRSVMLKLIPSLKTEIVDFDGLIDALIGMGIMSLISVYRLTRTSPTSRPCRAYSRNYCSRVTRT
jgi:hypothetical protein